MQANYVQRIRLRFEKSGNTRYIGHLDLVRTLERAINRAGIPIAYTQGFNRRMRLQMADALPLGYTSEGELADLWLKENVEPDLLMDSLGTVMPPGMTLHSAAEVPLTETALPNLTISAGYRVCLRDEVGEDEVQRRIEEILKESALPRENRGKIYDLRPRILSLSLLRAEDEIEIQMSLSLAAGEVGRPDEVLRAMKLDPHAARIHREIIVLQNHRS